MHIDNRLVALKAALAAPQGEGSEPLKQLKDWLTGEKEAASRILNDVRTPEPQVHAATGLHAAYRATLAKLDALFGPRR